MGLSGDVAGCVAAIKINIPARCLGPWLPFHFLQLERCESWAKSLFQSHLLLCYLCRVCVCVCSPLVVVFIPKAQHAKEWEKDRMGGFRGNMIGLTKKEHQKKGKREGERDPDGSRSTRRLEEDPWIQSKARGGKELGGGLSSPPQTTELLTTDPERRTEGGRVQRQCEVCLQGRTQQDG